jgi:hypothetical protein
MGFILYLSEIRSSFHLAALLFCLDFTVEEQWHRQPQPRLEILLRMSGEHIATEEESKSKGVKEMNLTAKFSRRHKNNNCVSLSLSLQRSSGH